MRTSHGAKVALLQNTEPSLEAKVYTAVNCKAQACKHNKTHIHTHRHTSPRGHKVLSYRLFYGFVLAVYDEIQIILTNQLCNERTKNDRNKPTETHDNAAKLQTENIWPLAFPSDGVERGVRGIRASVCSREAQS